MLKDDYMTISEASKNWGLSQRQVQHLCTLGSVEGAVKFGRAWMIPRNARKPIDGRTKAGRSRAAEDMPLPRKTPFLYMSNLYHTPGTADETAASLSYNQEAQVLFEAEVAYSRGQIDKVYDSANYLLNKHSGFYAVIGAGMLLAMCAIWKGDIDMWRRAKVHISEAPAKNDNDRDTMQLSINAVDIMLYNVQSFPKWFQIGCFEPLHKDAYPAAKVYYAKFLYAVAYSVATGALKLPGAEGLYVMTSVPYTIEPMICWANEQNTVMSEIYLRLTGAAVYHNYGNDKEAFRHIDRALALALPDKLYGTIAEYCRALDTLIEKRLEVIDPIALAEVKRLHKIYNEGWSKLSGAVRGKNIITTLSQKEREVAKLAAFGMSNREIAEKLHLSLSVVKQSVRIVSEKSGMSRSDFAAIL
ncbi:MAG: helix-turn-helix transcriptional regulator [Clostridia bacterium]|nr:helix-turn-helix transcriptional regulator [Clostridia bacterium]